MRLGRKLAVGVAEDDARPAAQQEEVAPAPRTRERTADEARERGEVPTGPAPVR